MTKDINEIWNELINHPDYVTTGPEELFSIQSLVETFRCDYEGENDEELTEDELVKLEGMIRLNKKNISDTIWEFFRSPYEYSHWMDDCEEYQEFLGN